MTDTLHSTEQLPEFLDGFVRIHNAMRRDAARLPRAVAHAVEGGRMRALSGWFAKFKVTLEEHHQREDTIVWPQLVARDPSFAEDLTELQADHHALDVALEGMDIALARGADVVRAAERLAEILVDHLAREEAAAFPRLATCFTAAEYDAIEQRMIKATPLRHLAFEVPWVLDGLSTEEFARIEAVAPRALRVLHRFVFAPLYARSAAPLLAVA